MKIIEKIIEYGLYLLAFLLPVQTRWIIKGGQINGGYSEYGTISLYGTDIILIVLLILFIIRRSFDFRFKISDFRFFTRGGLAFSGQNIIWYLIGGLWLSGLASIIFAPEKLVAGYSLLRLTLGIGLFWLLQSAKFDKFKLILSLIIAMTLESVLAIWQFLNQASFASKWLGMAIHRAGDLGTAVIETVGSDGIGERWLRAYGGLDHPNMLGGFLAVGIIIVISLIGLSRNNDQNKFKVKNSNIKIVALWIMLIIFFMAFIFSFSRSAWLGLAGAIIFILAMAIIRKNLFAQRNLLEVILVLGIIFFCLFNLFNNLFYTRISLNQRLETISISERIESVKIYKRIILDNWLTGTGIGNYVFAEKEVIKNQASYFYQPVPNIFLLVMAEGIFGLVFFTGIILYLFIINIRLEFFNKFNLEKYRISRFFYSVILLAITIMMLFDHWWLSLHFGIYLFWFSLGLATIKKAK